MNSNETSVEANAGADVDADMDEATAAKVEADFRRVMARVTDQAVTEGREEEVLAALFEVIVNVGDHDGEDPAE